MSFVFFFVNRLSPGFWCDQHSHHCWEIVYNVDSPGRVLFGGREEPYGPGSLLVHAPGAPHTCFNAGATVHYCLGAGGPDADALEEGVAPAGPEIARAFSELADEANEKRDCYKRMIEIKAEEILVLLFRRGLAARRDAEGDIPTSIRNMKLIMDGAYNKKIDLTYLSDEVMLSVDYIRHEFKRHYGVSPIQYLIGKRIEYATHLLGSSDMSVKQVAYQCGFENEYYFSRIFKKAKGISPTEQRQKLRGRDEPR